MVAQGWRVPDSAMDSTHSWNNDTDRAEFMKAFAEGSTEEKLMAAALTCADPNTPEAAIRRQLSVKPGSVRPVSMFDNTHEQPTVDVAWQNGADTDGIGKTVWDVNSGGNVQSSVRNSQERLGG